MTASYNPYVFLVVLMCLGVVCAIVPILFARFFAPHRPSKLKGATYECGVESKGDAWVQFRVQYYLYAILFVIFDIETVFLYPWAVAFNKLGLFAFVEMLIFLIILVCGLVYVWAKDVLEW